MAFDNHNFTAQIDAWCNESEDRLTAVFRESTQRVTSIANNGVPVDTGFARASVRASTEEMPSIDSGAKGEPGRAYPDRFGEITLTIAGAQLGQTIYIGWTAAYVLPLEYGHSKQAPAGFVRLAAAQWPQIVGEVVQEAKGRAALS